MAKRIKKPTPNEANVKHLQKIEYYVAKVNEIYDNLLVEFARVASNIPNINTAVTFDFDAYPYLKDKIAQLMLAANTKIINTLVEGISDAVTRANLKNDALVDQVFKAFKNRIPKEKIAEYKIHNLEAAVTREIKSELSPKVYKITKEFKRVTEIGIDQGIASGKSAQNLASEIRKAVKDPTPLFRKVKYIDKNGNPKTRLSKAAKEYRAANPGPGTGKYYNPVRNYQRLTRTEINMSYRTADFNRYQNFDFVVGIKVNLSNNPNHCPLCIRMAGLFPADYLFRGRHPNCRCYVTTVLKTQDEIDRDNIRILEGKEPLKASVNRVKKPHQGYFDWVEENKERLDRAKKNGTLPYWILDNTDINNNYKIVPGRIVGGKS